MDYYVLYQLRLHLIFINRRIDGLHYGNYCLRHLVNIERTERLFFLSIIDIRHCVARVLAVCDTDITSERELLAPVLSDY